MAAEARATALCANTEFDADCDCDCGRGPTTSECSWPDCFCGCDVGCKGCWLVQDAEAEAIVSSGPEVERD